MEHLPRQISDQDSAAAVRRLHVRVASYLHFKGDLSKCCQPTGQLSCGHVYQMDGNGSVLLTDRPQPVYIDESSHNIKRPSWSLGEFLPPNNVFFQVEKEKAGTLC